jgi:hypothetical protein
LLFHLILLVLFLKSKPYSLIHSKPHIQNKHICVFVVIGIGGGVLIVVVVVFNT